MLFSKLVSASATPIGAGETAKAEEIKQESVDPANLTTENQVD
jgi:hypothetical protein